MPPKSRERDWEERFFSMEEKYRRVQKMLQEKQDELRLEKVKTLKVELRNGRKSSVHELKPSLVNSSLHSQRKDFKPPETKVDEHHRDTEVSSSTHQKISPQAPDSARPYASNLSNEGDNPTVVEKRPQYSIAETDLDQLLREVTAPLPEDSPTMYADVATAGAFRYLGADEGFGRQTRSKTFSHQSMSRLNSFPAGNTESTVDPLLMLWGHNSFVSQNEALQQVNSTMKSALEESQAMLKTCQHDLASQRSLSNRLQQQLDEARIELAQAVRERDLASQKMTIASNTIAQQQSLLQTTNDEKEKMRFNLESQLRDLRSRLSSAAENNDALSTDTRTLIAELRDGHSKVTALQSRLVLAESSQTHLSNLNQTMVVELEALNQQLVNERKKLLSMARDLQANRVSVEERRSLELRINQLVQDKLALEKEHLKLLDSMVGITQTTGTQIRGEMEAQLEELRSAAMHWERVSELLFRDVSQRTASHTACREECEEAKRQRDEAMEAARSLRQELALANAKLDIMWPNHRKDTAFFEDIDTMKAALTRIVSTGRGAQTDKSAFSGTLGRLSGKTNAIADLSFLSDEAPEEIIRELQAANAAIYSELESLKAANEVLTDQLRMSQISKQDCVAAAKKEADETKWREQAALDAVTHQCDRIQFLEKQVALLRGFRVDPSMSIEDLAPNESIAEVFIGQLLSAGGSTGGNFQKDFPSLFCTIDFLVHESATTGVVLGYQSFFDTTMAYKFAQDSLFIHYLKTRGLRVQLYEKLPPGSSEKSYKLLAEGSVSLLRLLEDDDIRISSRPQVKGHVNLYCVPEDQHNIDSSFLSSQHAEGHHLGSVEYSVTIRTPFTPLFLNQINGELGALARSKTQSATRSPRHFADLSPGVIYDALERIKSISIEFVSCSIPYTVEQLPLLTFNYSIPQIGIDGSIPPAFQTPRYETIFAESDLSSHGFSGADQRHLRSSSTDCLSLGPTSTIHTVHLYRREFSDDEDIIRSSYRLSKALGESIPIVAFDENGSLSPNESVHYWALGLISWGEALENAARRLLSDHGCTEYQQTVSTPLISAEMQQLGTFTTRIRFSFTSTGKTVTPVSSKLQTNATPARNLIQQSIYSQGSKQGSPNTSHVYSRNLGIPALSRSQAPSTVASTHDYSFQ